MSVEGEQFYRDLRGSRSDVLVSMGTGVWDVLIPHGSKVDGVVFDFGESYAKAMMQSKIGRPSLDAVKWLWSDFGRDDIWGVGGVFYYYDHPAGSVAAIKKVQRVIVPIGFSCTGGFDGWVEDHRLELEKRWNLGTVAFGVNGMMYSENDIPTGVPHDNGSHGTMIFWDTEVTNNLVLRNPSDKFLVFSDIDTKVDDALLAKAGLEIGSPFLVAETRRGYHLIFPVLFVGGYQRDRLARVEGRIMIGLTRAGIGMDVSNAGHILETNESVIRVTSGLRRDDTPSIVGVVWGDQMLR